MGGWLRSVLIGLPSAVVLVLIFLLAMPLCATCGDQHEAVTALVQKCKRATDLLGDHAHPARMGVACGNTEVSGGNGTASWSLPYTGSRGRGTVSFDAVKRGGEWYVDRAVLEIADESIDLVGCAAARAPGPLAPSSARPSQTNADAMLTKFSGKIQRSTHPTLAAGTDCSGSLQREIGSPTAQVRVTCRPASGPEPLVLYDGRGSLDLDVRDASRLDDDHIEYDDGEPEAGAPLVRCRLSSVDHHGSLTVWSTTPSWEIVVTIELKE
jgi:hypothetical protein